MILEWRIPRLYSKNLCSEDFWMFTHVNLRQIFSFLSYFVVFFHSYDDQSVGLVPSLWTSWLGKFFKSISRKCHSAGEAAHQINLGRVPMFGVFSQSSMALYSCFTHNTHNMDQVIIPWAQFTACLLHASQRDILCPVTWPLAPRDSFIFYQQLIVIAAALWPDKDLHLPCWVIVYRWSPPPSTVHRGGSPDEFSSPQLGEAVAELMWV